MLDLRSMSEADFDSVAELIHLSTNSWYREKLGRSAFSGKPKDCRLFCEVYEELDSGCGLVIQNSDTEQIVGSCFYHPRETHISLGIMNVHPSYFGEGIAGRLLRAVIEESESRDLPLRLVSSALNLDSFSLYSRYGFSPHAIYQDMILKVPAKGIASTVKTDLPRVREATPLDLVAMGRLEFEISGISRERDYCYFLENESELWDTQVSLDEDDNVTGFLVSIDHPASRMIGSGVCQTEEAAEALLRSHLERFRGKEVVFLVPTSASKLVAAAYEMGARNCEIHFGQSRGEAQPVSGVVIPTFLPESM